VIAATAIVPVKRFAAAKQRLATGLDEDRKRELIEAMLSDVLIAIGEARTVGRALVVTGEPAAARIAHELGAEVVPDAVDAGHSEAALVGIEAAAPDRPDCVVLLPGDCPLLEPRDLDRLLTGLPERYVAVVPDRHGTGTNALVLSPPDAIRPSFGGGSCERHVASARRAGVPFSVEHVDTLALDLDTPADMIALTTAVEGGARAPNTARALGI
jgi:2-phospho-L-lactate/phosphoenolpyruvate guanylyltransferase